MALRDKVRVKKTISLSLTAEDWDLYSTKENVEGAANRLNVSLEHAVNSGMSQVEATRFMLREMEDLSSYGASDTEPGYVLADLLYLIYGDQG